MSKKTTVRLLSHTQHPLETIYCEWIQSRTQDPVPDPAKLYSEIGLEIYDRVKRKYGHYDEKNDSWSIVWGSSEDAQKMHENVGKTELEAKIEEVFEKVVAMRMPLGETISFTFLLENVSVALREQLVRHRIGHKFGDRLGADIVPDLAGGSSFWTQTTRIINMGEFASEGDYLTPEWLEEHGHEPMPGSMTMNPLSGAKEQKTKQDFYDEQMIWIQTAYKRLVKAGMPLEDARNILPVAMSHRMTWTTNFSALMHVLSRRGCWLAQLGMWRPVIEGIIEELATKIHPTMRRLIDPPCFGADGKFNACAFGKENEEIISIDNKGEYPPCSLWVNNDATHSPSSGEKLHSVKPGGFVEKTVVRKDRWPRYEKMMERYATLWRRDPRTGERIEIK